MVGKRPSSCRRIFLSLKIGDLDIDGTMKIVKEVYNILTGFGTPSYLLCNR
jgi:chromosome partitioning protein